MKGIILAGGNGMRLRPLTLVTNKHLLPVGHKPMIMHPLDKLVEAGLKDIMVITGTEHMGAIVNLLGSGRQHDCDITYRVQDEAGGIAQALALCEGFVGNQDCCVLLGDNIFSSSLTPLLDALQAARKPEGTSFGSMVVLKQVPIREATRFGVAILESGKVVRIVEKPVTPPSNYVVTGIYFYDMGVFEVIRGLKPSARGELEITDVNNEYARRKQLYCVSLSGEWTDAGTFESLARANEIMAEK